MANVNITLSAIDQTKPGIDSAVANLQKLNGAANSLGSTWGKTDPYRNAATQMDALNKAFVTQKSAMNMSSMSAMNLGRAYMNLMMTAAPLIATGVAIKKAYDLSKLGAEVEFTRTKFDRLSKTIGTTGDALLGSLRIATKGTISDFGLMKQGTDMLNLDLAKTGTEAIRLSRVMAGLGMDTGQLVLALANQSTRRLDQLNISLDRFNKIKKEVAATTGLTGQDLYKEAFLSAAEYGLNRMGNQADSQLGDYMRFEAGIENAKLAAGAWTARTIGNAASQKRTGPDWAYRTSDRLAGMRGTEDYNQLGKAPLGLGVVPQYGGGGATPGDETARQSSYDAMARYWMAPERTAGAGEGATRTPEELGGLLEGGLKMEKAAGKNSALVAAQKELTVAIADQQVAYDAVYKASGKYYERIEDQKSKTASLKAVLDDLTASGLQNELVYKNMSKEYQNQLGILNSLEGAYGKKADAVEKEKKALDDLKTKQKDAKQIAVDFGENMVLANLAADDSTKQLALDWALATGEISDQAYSQTTALESISEAMKSGMLTDLGKAKDLVGKVMSWDGAQGFATMTIYVNYILGGGGGGIGAGAAAFGVTPAYSLSEKDIKPIMPKPPKPGQVEAQAKGGKIGSNFAMVGEEGFEYMFKQGDEWIVVPHEASAWMAKVGIMPDRGFAGGGTVGGRTVSRSTSSRGVSYSTGGSRSRSSGGGGSASAFSSEAEAVSQAIPEITAAVGGTVEQSLASSPQLQALSASVAELRSVNETLVAILEKTASAGDIGRSVNGDLARVA